MNILHAPSHPQKMPFFSETVRLVKMSEVNLEELRQALVKLREQNRNTATENMILREELRLTEMRSEKLTEKFLTHKESVQEETEKQQMQMDTEVQGIIKKRRVRRRALIRQIREKTSENEKLESEIRSMESQMTKMRKIKESFPKDLTRKIRAGVRRDRLTHNPQSPIRV